MTEEIMIDGVDVAGCCYYESKNDTGKWCDLTCTRDNAPVFRCEKMPNCHFKQLQRLKQENEELKALNEKICEDCAKEIKYYWKALEEIKEYIVDELCGYYHSKKDDYNEILEKIESIIDEVLTNEN